MQVYFIKPSLSQQSNDRWSQTKVVPTNYLRVRVSASRKQVKQETREEETPARNIHATQLQPFLIQTVNTSSQ